MMYFIAATCPAHNTNQDLFVNAESPRVALQLWRKYYVDDLDPEPRVCRVPTGVGRGAVSWSTIDWEAT